MVRMNFLKTRVVVVDEHVVWRDLLRLALPPDGEHEIVGEGGTGSDALRLCRELRPEILILDLALAEITGADVLCQLRIERLATRALVCTGTRREETIIAALRAHPHGFVHKSDPLEVFREALRTVASGGRYLSAFACRFSERALEQGGGGERLTLRERSVLKMVAEGFPSKMIGDRLGIAPKTIEHHRARVMAKLGVHDVATLTRTALRLGLVE